MGLIEPKPDMSEPDYDSVPPEIDWVDRAPKVRPHEDEELGFRALWFCLGTIIGILIGLAI